MLVLEFFKREKKSTKHLAKYIPTFSPLYLVAFKMYIIYLILSLSLSHTHTHLHFIKIKIRAHHLGT